MFTDRNALEKRRANLHRLTNVYDLVGGVDKVRVLDPRRKVRTQEWVAPSRGYSIDAVAGRAIEEWAEARI